MSLEQGFNSTSGTSILDWSLDLHDRAKKLGWRMVKIGKGRAVWELSCGEEAVTCKTLEEIESWLDHVERNRDDYR